MKKFLLGSVALGAMLAGPAMAADMPVKAPPPIVYYDWSGLYLGFNVGGTWYDVDRTYPNAPLENFRTSDSDAIFGFHAGVQGQWGHWVLGIETALSACARECRSLSALLPAPPFAADRLGEHKITNLFTVGPRLGYAWDRWMIYATGGAAFATLKGQYCVASTGLCGVVASAQNGQSFNWGWYAGGGIEYMIHKGSLVDVILGAEYQHYDVRERSAFCLNAACNPAAVGFDYNLDAVGDLARVRLTIKTHGWDIFWAPTPPPVVTK
jgi:outer membrane immunogenic protein